MNRRWCSVSVRTAPALGGLLFLSLAGIGTMAQEPTRSAPPVAVHESVETAPPISPEKSPGPKTLDECIAMGYQYQPALDAARASLSAAQAGQRGVNSLIIPRLFRKDLPIRREQACNGVTIQQAVLSQAETETRYAITRNFFTVQYIRSQDVVVSEVLENLRKARSRAQKLFDNPPVDSKITKNDLDSLDIQTAIVKGKKAQIDNGMLKAVAALREAIGLKYDYPLELAAVDLPPAVWVEKIVVKKKDVKGKDTVIEKFHQLYKIDDATRRTLIDAAIANRGEMIQANVAARVVQLEVQAQQKIFGWQGDTFAKASDIHVQQPPQSLWNGEYRPGGFTIEMPTTVVGRKHDRMARTSALSDRANAVVDKATSLVSLDVEAQYLKWREAAEEVQELSGVQKIAKDLPDKVQNLNPNEFTSSAVIQSNMTAIAVRTQLNDAMHMHALALAGLERATAGAFQIYPIPAAPK